VLPDDTVRIARLRSRLGPWLGAGATVDAPTGDVLGARQATNSVAPAVGASAVAPKLVMLLVGAGLAVSAAAAWPRLPAFPARARAVSSTVLVDPPAAIAPGMPSPATAPELGDARPSQPHGAAKSEREQAPSLRKAAKAAAPSPEAGDSLSEQAALLSQARQRLDVSPAEAISLLAEHARRFPNSTLSEERRLFTIQALARSGRLDDAKRELEMLERSSPRSPHLARARRLVGAGNAPP
jgi:hypothetical protein